MSFDGIYRDRRVLVTGHTGFKGSWLCEWLLQLGAKVTGFSLPPPSQPALFERLCLESRLQHVIGDVRELNAVERVVQDTKPAFIFHLAAQPLVRVSYVRPDETFATNLMGTVNLLEAVRRACCPCAVVAITTDKCYENKEWIYGYREDDPMGGYDPYSASKGAAELAISAYRRSYFSTPDSAVRLASARAGNVIGGGDWAQDRIIPDCVRALEKGAPILVRNKTATRPWQHVLEPLSGYLWLGACLAGAYPRARASQVASAYNFGPGLTCNRSTEELVQEVLKFWPGSWRDCGNPNPAHEAGLLNLSTEKAFHHLGWKHIWDFQAAVEKTVVWYQSHAANPSSAKAVTQRQIAEYTASGRAGGLPWTVEADPGRPIQNRGPYI
jgi:CDP-glucose 4,6-dehydratase